MKSMSGGKRMSFAIQIWMKLVVMNP